VINILGWSNSIGCYLFYEFWFCFIGNIFNDLYTIVYMESKLIVNSLETVFRGQSQLNVISKNCKTAKTGDISIIIIFITSLNTTCCVYNLIAFDYLNGQMCWFSNIWNWYWLDMISQFLMAPLKYLCILIQYSFGIELH